MTYSPSPRPTFDGPTHIPYEAARRHLWGDKTAGEVADWIYVSSDQIHQLVFGLPAGAMFRHSEAHRTVFAADEIYYVLSGVLLMSNPETGEVQRALPSEAEHQILLQVVTDVLGLKEVVDDIGVEELLWEREDRSKQEPADKPLPWQEPYGTEDIVECEEEGKEFVAPSAPTPEEE